MTKRLIRSGAALIAAVVALAIPLAGTLPAQASTSDPLPPGTHFYTPRVPDGARAQIAQLASSGDKKDAALISDEVTTPQAAWFTGGTAREVQQQVRRVA
jgi:endoglucanase